MTTLKIFGYFPIYRELKEEKMKILICVLMVLSLASIGCNTPPPTQGELQEKKINAENLMNELYGPKVNTGDVLCRCGAAEGWFSLRYNRGDYTLVVYEATKESLGNRYITYEIVPGENILESNGTDGENWQISKDNLSINFDKCWRGLHNRLRREHRKEF